jgi:hypothetical protein
VVPEVSDSISQKGEVGSDALSGVGPLRSTGSEVKARDREIGGSEWAGEGGGTRELAASGDQMSKVGEEEQFLE